MSASVGVLSACGSSLVVCAFDRQVSKRNLQGIVRRLMEHLDLSDGSYRSVLIIFQPQSFSLSLSIVLHVVCAHSDHVLERILFICSQKSYSFISDFSWCVCSSSPILVRLAGWPC